MPSNKSSISNSCYGEDSDIPTQQRHRIVKPHSDQGPSGTGTNSNQPTIESVFSSALSLSLSLSAHSLFGLSLVVSKARGWDVSQIIESQITMVHAKVLVAFFAPSPFFTLVVHSFFCSWSKAGHFCLSDWRRQTNGYGMLGAGKGDKSIRG